jgi:acyl-CoA thioesterase
MTKFETDTALKPLGDGRFEGCVSPDWRIVRGANGGHLAAILLRAMTLAVGDESRVPATMSVHFARVPREEPFEVDVSLERTGRTMSNVSARMVQDRKVIAIGISAFSTARTGPDFSDLRMPEVPPAEAIEPVTDREDFPFGRQFDFRRALGPAVGESSERAELGVWMRLREPQPIDHIVATQLLDAFAPAVFAKLGQGGGGAGVPTIEMTFHYRERLPLPGAEPDAWYLGLFRTMTSRGGFVEEDGWLWSADGRLVAQSRQFALIQDGA